jgi:putative transposase
VTEWAKLLKASRSGYYAYIERLERREEEKKNKKATIKKIFDDSGGTYGPDRICGELRKRGHKASYKKIGRYMSEMGLSSIHNRHRSRSLTDSRKARGEGYPNLVAGQIFDKPYQAVCSDITYLKSGEGWLYLCKVKDIVSGEILGEAYSTNMKKELVIQAILNTLARHKLPAGAIFHGDRGSQYTSKAVKELLELYGIKQSFSRVGMPGDNAWAESFFATLKKECIHFRHFATKEELKQTVFAWIHSFYNTKRIQKRLGYLSPREYATLLLSSNNTDIPEAA